MFKIKIEMKVETQELVNELDTILNMAIEKAKAFQELPEEKLNYRQKEDSWTILECIEHLNLYGDFYVPEIESNLASAKTIETTNFFKSGLLGNYFAEMMRIKSGKISKMATFKDKNPLHANLTVSSIEKFIYQCDKLKKMLPIGKIKGFSQIKTGISISPFIKLRLGDTFRVVIYHIERHLVQAEKVLDSIGEL